MDIPVSLYQNDTVQRSVNSRTEEGSISCGFLHKPSAAFSDKDCTFQQYGAFLLLSGRGVYKEENGEEIPLSRGAYVQRIPGRLHSTIVDESEEWLEFFVCFGKELYQTLVHLDLLGNEPVIYPGVTQEVLKKCLFLLRAYKTMTEAQQPFLYSYTQNFAMEMYAIAKQRKIENASDYRMAQAKEMLSQVKPELITPQVVAKQLDLSYENFRKRFKKCYHISPFSYQLNSRIEYAKMLLLDSTKTINEIALICSFADGFSFSKAFKQRSGEAPTDFRKRQAFDV